MKLEQFNPKVQQRLKEAMANEDRASSEKPRSNPQLQELQAGSPKGEARNDHHRTKNKKVDARVHPSFRVTVILSYSDRRRRDIDGAASTVLDCIVTASRRFVGLDT